MSPLARLALGAIAAYQRRGGGGRHFAVACNFTPSCSDYARQAIARYGFLRGARLALGRARRCTVRDQVGKIDDPVPAAEC
jgi:putative component of membrane protein insertase Oxa1/YidC/SpoIIIJ protein YidD